MTVDPIGLEELSDARDELVREVHRRLGKNEKAFLLSVKRLEPDWDLLGVPGAQDLPAVQFKLRNLARMPEEHRVRALRRLEELFDRV